MATSTSRNVVIHVFDEFRKTSKDFVCPRDLLLSKMKYFRSYLNQSNESDEIDISVHCDVEIFEWLVEYMLQHQSGWKQRITMDNIASILVSSEFLEMDVLVDECINFIASRISDFVQLRVDFGCLSDNTITRIASKCNAIDLEHLHDPKDKMFSRLMRKKVEWMLSEIEAGNDTLLECMICKRLYSKSAGGYLHCPGGQPQLTAHGEVIALHRERSGWNAEDWIRAHITDQGATYASIYWLLWASTKSFHCTECRRHLSFLDVYNCAYHPGSVVGVGVEAKFSCCGTELTLGGELGAQGCHVQAHACSVDMKQYQSQLQVLVKYHDSDGKSDTRSQDTRPLLDIFVSSTGDRSFNRQPPPLAGGAISPRRHKQWQILCLQELDRGRAQVLSRALMQLRSDKL